MGESIYKFSLREIPGAFLRAWNLEKVRLERVGKGVWSLDNEIIPPLMITLAVYTALVLALGPNTKLLVFLPTPPPPHPPPPTTPHPTPHPDPLPPTTPPTPSPPPPPPP